MTVSLRTAEPADVAEYLSDAREHYLSELLRAGVDRQSATKNADDSFSRSFPDGQPAPGHLLFRVERDGGPVGFLWIGPNPPSPEDHWWVWDVIIDEAHRGQGIGRETMLLAEAEARARGVSQLGLNVFGFNAVAIDLYRSLGYEVTAMQMRKAL